MLAIFFWPVGLVLSLMSLGRTKRAGAGHGLAVAGVIISVLALLGSVGAGFAIVKGVSLFAAPGQSVTRLYQSIETGNCDEYMATTTANYRTMLGAETCADYAGYSGDAAGISDITVKVSSVNITNNDAVVVADVSYKDSATGEATSTTATVDLVRQGGKWLVDYDSFS